jgi:hypothetical protein
MIVCAIATLLDVRAIKREDIGYDSQNYQGNEGPDYVCGELAFIVHYIDPFTK